PVSALNSVLLPAFGLPRTAIVRRLARAAVAIATGSGSAVTGASGSVDRDMDARRLRAADRQVHLAQPPLHRVAERRAAHHFDGSAGHEAQLHQPARDHGVAVEAHDHADLA